MSSDSPITEASWRGKDPAGRKVDYLRISITDRCNERCLYCMPEGFRDWKERDEILSYEEILSVVRAATRIGFSKFRITGGEPLARKGVPDLVREMAAIRGIASIGLTTNGTRLAPLASGLRRAGLHALNISLDALTPSVYRAITRGEVKAALEGIHAAIEAGFERIKLNTVLIRGMNEGEIWPLIRFAAEHRLLIRFIELMPVSLSEMLNERNFLPAGEVMRSIAERDVLQPMDDARLGNGPARYYRLERTGITVGFIGAISNLHFCDDCNKIRLTADGKIRPCLGNHGEFDLKPALRRTGSDGGEKGDREVEDAVVSRIQQALAEKPPEHIFRKNYEPDRVMTAIGG